jgi:hypothetical protein
MWASRSFWVRTITQPGSDGTRPREQSTHPERGRYFANLLTIRKSPAVVKQPKPMPNPTGEFVHHDHVQVRMPLTIQALK